MAELLPDGTLHLVTDADLSKVGRVLVSQNGTHYGVLYYADGEPKPSAQPEQEIVMCKDCAKRSFTKCPMALSRQSDYDFCSRAERKDGR